MALCTFLSLLSLLHMLYFGLQILFAHPTLRVQYIPDDAFYYLGLAKNFIANRTWTFDSGFSVTSGFHVFHAYLLTVLYGLFRPGPEAFIQIGAATGLLFAAAMTYHVWRNASQRGQIYLLIFLATATTAPNFLLNSVSIMEWSLGLVLAGWYFLSFHRSIAEQKPSGVFFFLLGFALSIARSDAGLLPFSIWIADVLTRSFRKNAVSFIGLLGAAAGVALVLMHNQYFTGELLQSSARVKAYWAQSQGVTGSGSILTLAYIFNILGLDLSPNAFQHSFTLLMTGCLLFPALFLALGWKGRQAKIPLSTFGLNEAEKRYTTLPLAAIFCILGYALVYGLSAGQQQWYTVNLLAPVACLYVTCGEYLHTRLLPEKNFTTIWFLLMALLVMGYNLFNFYPLNSEHAPWPHQTAMRTAGIFLQNNPLDEHIGAWNAGIIGYYQGGQVINLDGLVNNDAAGYVVGNALDDYLASAQIGYIIDFENMLHPRFALRGGYADASFLKRLVPLQVFDNGQYPEWKFLRLYKIE